MGVKTGIKETEFVKFTIVRLCLPNELRQQKCKFKISLFSLLSCNSLVGRDGNHLINVVD